MNHAVLPPVAPWVRVLRPLAWGGALVLLAAPWVAMRFTDQVAWSGGDFAVFGALLLGALSNGPSSMVSAACKALASIKRTVALGA